MTNNIAASTTQEIRRRLFHRGWVETKSQHFQFTDPRTRQRAEFAIEVGYVLGESTVKVIPLDDRGAEGALHTRTQTGIMRGVGDEYVAEVVSVMERIERLVA